MKGARREEGKKKTASERFRIPSLTSSQREEKKEVKKNQLHGSRGEGVWKSRKKGEKGRSEKETSATRKKIREKEKKKNEKKKRKEEKKKR